MSSAYVFRRRPRRTRPSLQPIPNNTYNTHAKQNSLARVIIPTFVSNNSTHTDNHIMYSLLRKLPQMSVPQKQGKKTDFNIP